MLEKCKICSSGNDAEINTNFKYFITSDCNITNMQPKHWVCAECGLIQKNITDNYLQELQNLYLDYKIYDQGNSSEQLIFTQDKVPQTRNKVLFDLLNSKIKLNCVGNLAEIGCGFGNFLKAFNSELPRWSLHGYDLSDQYKEIVNAIPNTRYFKQNFSENDIKYDLIAAIHVLEHLVQPLEFLIDCKNSLSEGGHIFIQIPNIATSTFDLIIADHISHFSELDIKRLASLAGLKVDFISGDLISKELFCLLSPLQNSEDQIDKHQYPVEGPNVQIILETIRSFEAIAENQTTPVKIFGSSIGASWLSRYCSQKIECFIDEDPSRVGNSHLGINIEPISTIKENDNLILPFPKKTAFHIKQKLQHTNSNFLHPDL